MAQTWHQVRPGEVRNNCGGCHAHSRQPLDFEGTFAGRPGYEPVDLSTMVTLLTKDAQGQPAVKTNALGAINVEFLRDIRPVLQRSCVPCHTGSTNNPPGNLVLDDYTSYGGLPGDYTRLEDDTAARWGHKPVIANGSWRQSNASRYVRMFQSRRSLLIWKIFGRRLDGWTNVDHPTETVPGDSATLPSGASASEADVDHTGEIMPPPGSGVPPLSEDEKMTFARWVDLGCPINSGTGGNADYGWFADELPPTLTVSSPCQNRNTIPLTEIRVGVADAYTGLDTPTLSIKADFPVNGAPTGAELAGQGSFIAPGIYSIPLEPPISNLATSLVTASVADLQGNTNRVEVRFWVESSFRILSVDASALANRSLTLRFDNPAGATTHRVEATDSLLSPSTPWLPLTILDAGDEAGGIRRVEVELTPQLHTYRFFRVVLP